MTQRITPLYNESATTLVTATLNDKSEGHWVEVDAKLQIVVGEHAVVLDFDLFADITDTAEVEAVIAKEAAAVERLFAEVSRFKNEFIAKTNAILADAGKVAEQQ